MTRNELLSLAEKYENAAFYKNSDGSPRDPAFFMHQYENKVDQEIVALLSASLAFGKRSEILKAIQKILDEIKNAKMQPADWVKSAEFLKMFPDGKKGYYYRTFSHQNLHDFFKSLQGILGEADSLGDFFRVKIINSPLSIINSFNCSPLIPKNASSACKRVCLFLRWMVRKSEVDLGLWDFIDKKDLIIPLDTHVMQSAKKLGIISSTSTSATMKTAKKITEEMKKIFGDDPCKADFALFGADIDSLYREN